MPSSDESGVGLTYCQLLSLLCCPPSLKGIINKLAFQPPQPTYSFNTVGSSSRLRLHLFDAASWPHSERERKAVECLRAVTRRGNSIACVMVPCAGAKHTILFSHGNHVDLGEMCSFYQFLVARINCNVFGYDYSGYGESTGKPSEKNAYADIAAAYHTLLDVYDVPAERVVLFGVSIGTAPSVDLASRHAVGGVVLQSPFTSAYRIVRPNANRTWFFDAFPTIDKVSLVSAPVLVIHGTDDDVITCAHGVAIYSRCAQTVEPLWLEGGGHSDLAMFPQYFPRLRRFFAQEL